MLTNEDGTCAGYLMRDGTTVVADECATPLQPTALLTTALLTTALLTTALLTTALLTTALLTTALLTTALLTTALLTTYYSLQVRERGAVRHLQAPAAQGLGQDAILPPGAW